MKKLLFTLVIIAAGLGLGGAAAFGTLLLLGPRPAGALAKAPEEDPAFVAVDKILAPLVFADGRLAGYTQFQIQLEVPKDQLAFVNARLPLLLHAINMRTFRTPLAAGPDGQLPNVEEFRKLVMSVAPEAFGAGMVRKVAITQAVPA